MINLITISDHTNGEGNGNPFQYSCLENPMGREAWRATVHGVIRVGHDLATKSSPPPYKTVQTTESKDGQGAYEKMFNNANY